MKARGTYFERVATIDSVVLSVVSWYGNKVVTLLSNFIGTETTTEVRRFKKEKKRSNILRFHAPKLLLYITNTWEGLAF